MAATEKRVNIQLKPGKISRQNTVTRATGVLNEDGSVFLRYRGNDYHDWASLVEKELPDADFCSTMDPRVFSALEKAGFPMKGPENASVSLHVTIPASLMEKLNNECMETNQKQSSIVRDALNKRYGSSC